MSFLLHGFTNLQFWISKFHWQEQFFVYFLLGICEAMFFFYFRLIIQPTLPTNGLHNWWGDLLFSNRCSPNWCFWESCATFMARRINLIVIFDVFPWAPPAHWNEGKKKGSYQKPVYLHLIYYLMNHQITYAFCYWN